MPYGLCDVCEYRPALDWAVRACERNDGIPPSHNVDYCPAFRVSTEAARTLSINLTGGKVDPGEIRVVEKAWGKELVVANESGYSGKMLVIDKGRRCSHHFHIRKHETFHVLDGVVLFHIGASVVVGRNGDIFTIPPKQIHSFGIPTGLPEFPGGGLVYEVATRDYDGDSYRLDESGPIDDEWLGACSQ